MPKASENIYIKKARDPIFGFPAPESVLGRNPGLRAQAGFSHVLIGFGPKGDRLEVNRGDEQKREKLYYNYIQNGQLCR